MTLSSAASVAERIAKDIREHERSCHSDCLYTQTIITTALAEAKREQQEEDARVSEGFCTSSKQPCDAVESCQPEAIANAIRRRSRTIQQEERNESK